MSREPYDSWLEETRKSSDSGTSSIEAGKPHGDYPPPVPPVLESAPPTNGPDASPA